MKPHGRSGRRIAILVSALLLLSATTMIFLPREASAHPLGNFTVNHYSRISLGPDQVFVRYVLDMAEIPAFREIRAIDADGNDEVSNDESTACLDEKVRGLTGGLLLTVNDSLIELRVLERGLEFPPGQGGLRTLRLSMLLSGAIPLAGRGDEMELYYRDDNYTQQAGWREIVVQSREGVVVIESTAPQIDTSNELRDYPSNCLESQEEWPATVGVRSHQGERCLSMELRITSSLRMQAVRANFFGLPAASSRW